MDTSTTIKIVNGRYGKFYILNNVKYDIHFPLAWALSHLPYIYNGIEYKSGPEGCEVCLNAGSINNVFVGYCHECSQLYDEKRKGCYFMPNGTTDEELWAMMPYLYGVGQNCIGCDYNDCDENNEQVEQPVETSSQLQTDNEPLYQFEYNEYNEYDENNNYYINDYNSVNTINNNITYDNNSLHDEDEYNEEIN